MSFTEITCPHCLKPAPVDPKQAEAFCVYCGEKLSVRPIADVDRPPATGVRENWDELLQEGRYDYILRNAGLYLQEGEKSTEPQVYYALARLNQLYGEYLADIRRESRERGPFARLFGGWLSKGSGAEDSSIHAVFFQNVLQLSDKLVGMLREIEGTALCRTAAARAVQLLLVRDSENVDTAAAVAYESLERSAFPFFPLLDNEELDRQYAFYRPHSRRRLLGREVLRAIKQERSARNLG